jgi:hypothetical protein
MFFVFLFLHFVLHCVCSMHFLFYVLPMWACLGKGEIVGDGGDVYVRVWNCTVFHALSCIWSSLSCLSRGQKQKPGLHLVGRKGGYKSSSFIKGGQRCDLLIVPTIGGFFAVFCIGIFCFEAPSNVTCSSCLIDLALNSVSGPESTFLHLDWIIQ